MTIREWTVYRIYFKICSVNRFECKLIMTLINLDTSPLKLYLGVKGHLMVIDDSNKLAKEIRLTL